MLSTIETLRGKIRALVNDIVKSDKETFTYTNSAIFILAEENIESITQITKNGKQCTRSCINKFKKCWQHGGSSLSDYAEEYNQWKLVEQIYNNFTYNLCSRKNIKPLCKYEIYNILERFLLSHTNYVSLSKSKAY